MCQSEFAKRDFEPEFLPIQFANLGVKAIVPATVVEEQVSGADNFPEFQAGCLPYILRRKSLIIGNYLAIPGIFLARLPMPNAD